MDAQNSVIFTAPVTFDCIFGYTLFQGVFVTV